jgi:hypothetical protein
MKIKKGFVLRQVCGENVITGEGLETINFGKLLSLNETAAWLWQQAAAMGDFTVEALTAQLCETYDVAEDVAFQDVSNIVNEWLKVEVIE